jgi:hypothetical protein
MNFKKCDIKVDEGLRVNIDASEKSFVRTIPQKYVVNVQMNVLVSNSPNILIELENLYKKYTVNVENISKCSSVALKRSFDDYINTIQTNFSMKLDNVECKKLNEMFKEQDDKIVEVQNILKKNHDESRGSDSQAESIYNSQNSSNYQEKFTSWESFFIKDELKCDYFFFYKILIKIWFGEHIKKSEIDQLQPCKVLITRSLVKRKFGEEIDMRSDKKKPEDCEASS